jgi:heparan-alpha-glucosaminide N-acetyltransferase
MPTATVSPPVTAPAGAPPRESPPPPGRPPVQRYLALDAYRGFIMLMLISTGFGFHALKEHATWGWLARQFDHVAWEGGVFWDLVQPAFMFIVGVAMPFALAVREQKGATFADNARHVAIRALKLVLLSQALMIISGQRLHFQLINVLSQIAFTYFLTFWILQLRPKAQVGAAAGLLAFHSALFYLFPGPEGPFSKEGNIGQAIDLAVLGYNYPGFYVTINFLTSTVTTLAGAWTGLLLLSDRSDREKLKWIVLGALAAFALGFASEPLVPNVKRIWTATFTFYSAGWVLAMMAAFFWTIEMRGWRRWTFPLVVIGMNSIFIYSVSIVLRRWFYQAVGSFTGNFEWVGDLAPVVHAMAATAAMWYLCYWLYQRRIYFKL